jgi:hypothetical protein
MLDLKCFVRLDKLLYQIDVTNRGQSSCARKATVSREGLPATVTMALELHFSAPRIHHQSGQICLNRFLLQGIPEDCVSVQQKSCHYTVRQTWIKTLKGRQNSEYISGVLSLLASQSFLQIPSLYRFRHQARMAQARSMPRPKHQEVKIHQVHSHSEEQLQ